MKSRVLFTELVDFYSRDLREVLEVFGMLNIVAGSLNTSQPGLQLARR